MTSLALNGSDAAAIKADALVVGIASSGRGRKAVVVATDAKTAKKLGDLAATLASLGATGAADEVVRVPAPRGVAADVVRRRRPRGRRLLLPRDPAALGRRSSARPGRHPASGLRAADRRPRRPRGRGDGRAARRVLLHRLPRRTARPSRRPPSAGSSFPAHAPTDKPARAVVRRVQAIVESVHLARDYVNTPPNALRPPNFASEAGEAARAVGLEVRDPRRGRAQRPAATAASWPSGQGSEAPPRLLRLAHRHPDATQHLALIGKGITFDTGGISIKPAAGMEAMKNDMGGAAAVIAATIAIARLGLAVNVTTYAPMAENMPSGSATRPVRRLRRLRRQDRRGAQHRRRGPAHHVRRPRARHRGLPRRHHRRRDPHRRPAGRSRGPVPPGSWPTTTTCAPRSTRRPRWSARPCGRCPCRRSCARASTRRSPTSPTSTTPGWPACSRPGSSSSEFVQGFRWAHLDIAGPAFENGAPWGHTSKGGTGFAVRTLVQVAEDLADDLIARDRARRARHRPKLVGDVCNLTGGGDRLAGTTPRPEGATCALPCPRLCRPTRRWPFR